MMEGSSDAYFNTSEEATRGSAVRTSPHSAFPESNLFNLQKESSDSISLQKQKEYSSVTEKDYHNWTPKNASTLPNDVFKVTSINLTNMSIQDIMGNLTAFSDREFQIEMYDAKPDQGFMELGIFVNTMLVCCSVQLWSSQAGSVLLEVSLLSGDSFAFAEAYRVLKEYFTTNSFRGESTSSSVKSDWLDGLEGEGLPLPSDEDWDALIDDCRIDGIENIDSIELKGITENIESVVSICSTYNAKDLSYVCENLEKIFSFELFYNEETNDTMKYQQIWDFCVLIQHLMTCDDNIMLMNTDIVLLLEAVLRTECDMSLCWFSVLHMLSETLMKIVTAQGDGDVKTLLRNKLENNTKITIPSNIQNPNRSRRAQQNVDQIYQALL